MALYEYRCERDGAFDIVRRLGEAPAWCACPVCDADAPRVFTAPMLKSLPRALVSALDHEDKTREAPDVVTALPPAPAGRRTPMAPLTPALMRLPRP
jgi:putative FmdB family regulatory protein